MKHERALPRQAGNTSMVMAGMIVGLLSLGLGSQARATESATMSLNGTWKFAYAPDEAHADALAKFYKPDFNTGSFENTPVPSNWALLGYEMPNYRAYKLEDAGQGFYLRTFTVSKEFAGKRVLLHFGGVWSSAEIWLNGKPIGRHDSGFTGFAYDVTSRLKTEGDNVLAVRVRQVQPDHLFDVNDDWLLGGIYRDVTLEATPRDRFIDRVDVQTDFDEKYTDADLKVRILSTDGDGDAPSGGSEPYELRLSLLDQRGTVVQSEKKLIPAHNKTGRETTITMRVAKPLHWTAETPNLYRLRVELIHKGQSYHTRQVNVGFREISTAGGVFRINGQAVKLRGVNRHDEHPDVGRATRPEHWLRDIELMKAANINMVRLAHYPHAQGFLDLCDSMGLYVLNEVPMGTGGNFMNDPGTAGAVALRSYETVERDINHPSVIVWGIGNEDPLTALHMASIRMVKGLDPTRPVLLPWRAESALPPEVDILAPHYPTAAKLGSLAAKADRPVITTEYSHAYGEHGLGDLQARWNALTQYPAGAGGSIWMWADQGLKVGTRKPDGTVDTKLKVTLDGWDGITDPYRNPTRDYWETKAVYAPVFPSSQSVAIAPGQGSVRIPVQNAFDFTDLRAVKVVWALFEDDLELASASASLSGGPHAQAQLDVPLTAIKQVKPGATYYVQLRFAHADGREIIRRSVELTTTTAAAAGVTTSFRPSVATRDVKTVVRAGDAEYTFDNATGQLAGAAWKGKTLLSDMRPVLWRPINETEGRRVNKKLLAVLPDLNRYAAKASGWRVSEDAGGVAITSTVDYAIDDKNSFKIDYAYSIGTDGALKVRYRIATRLQAEWLPQIGMDFATSAQLQKLRWLGMGPYDSFPNLQAAPYLGVWSGAPGSPDVSGIKRTRWIDLSDDSGTGVRISSDGYMGSDPASAGRLRVLSAVAGRPTKFGLAENVKDQLRIDEGQQYGGKLSISLNR